MRTVSPEKEQAVEERRWKIWRLRVVHKLDLCEIVKLVRVCRRTVESDLAEMRDVRSDHIRLAHAEQQETIDAAIEVAEQCDAVCREAWANHNAADKGSFARAKFLSIVLHAVRTRIEVLQSVGLLPTAADEVILTDASIRDLTDREADEMIACLKVYIRGGGTAADLKVGKDREDRAERRKAARRRGKTGAAALPAGGE